LAARDFRRNARQRLEAGCGIEIVLADEKASQGGEVARDFIIDADTERASGSP
jgi:hypothetical protein